MKKSDSFGVVSLAVLLFLFWALDTYIRPLVGLPITAGLAMVAIIIEVVFFENIRNQELDERQIFLQLKSDRLAVQMLLLSSLAAIYIWDTDYTRFTFVTVLVIIGLSRLLSFGYQRIRGE